MEGKTEFSNHQREDRETIEAQVKQMLISWKAESKDRAHTKVFKLNVDNLLSAAKIVERSDLVPMQDVSGETYLPREQTNKTN